ncbi:hypothetical protein ACWGH2_42010 [Streptomyces sp. NPDC054871]
MSSTSNYGKLRADAAAEVERELAKIGDPFRRRTHAEELRDQAYMEVASLRSEREQLLAAVALADGRVTKQTSDMLGMAFSFAVKVAAAHNSVGLEAGRRWTTPEGLENARQRSPYRGQDPADVRAQARTVGRQFQAADARHEAALTHLEAAHEAVRTAGGRVRVGALERPDFAEIRRTATEEIRAEFATLAVAPEERLRLAAEAVDQAEEEKAALLPERDEAVSSLAFYTTARAVYASAGLSRNGMKRVLERALGLPREANLPPRPEQPTAARDAGVPFLKGAAEELPQIAAVYEAAYARHAAAVEIRDAAILVLNAAPYEWGYTRIAEHIGRDPSVVHRVVNPR